MEIILPLYNFELQDDIIAGVSRGKGQDLFLRAFYESLLLIKEKKLQVPSLHAVVVGSDMNAHTKLEKELRQFVMEKKIQDRVHFVNKTLAVAPYLASIDVLVQNSQVSFNISCYVECETEFVFTLVFLLSVPEPPITVLHLARLFFKKICFQLPCKS